MPRDYYEVLGVPRDADEAAVKKAFRRLARELHPDVNAHDPDAEAKFKEAAEAYEVLSDGDRRQAYDTYGHEGLRRGGYAPDFGDFGSISDLFSAFFGAGGFDAAFGGGRMRGGPIQGGDVAVAVQIELVDAARGTQVEVAYDARARCHTCHGNGAKPGTPIETCPRCQGSGQLQAVSRTAFGQMVRTAICDTCGGDGRVARDPCDECGGDGMVVERKRVEVGIPAGIADGQRIHISARGHAGERGGPNGDLYVVVRVAEDERFLRDGERPDHGRRRPRAAGRARHHDRRPVARRPDPGRGQARHAAGGDDHARRSRDAARAPGPHRRPARGRQRHGPAPAHVGAARHAREVLGHPHRRTTSAPTRA